MNRPRSPFSGSKPWIELFKIDPPRGSNADELLRNLPPPGYGLLVVDDNPGALPAMAATSAAIHLVRNGYNPILMINCRDRNRIDLQSVVLGAVSHGIHYFLIQPGTHQIMGPMRDAKNVYDVDPIQSLKILNDMRKRHVLSNNMRIAGSPDFYIGLFEHPMRGDLDMKPYFFRKKMWHQVDFIVTDPVTDYNRLDEWRQAIAVVEGSNKIPIFIGVQDTASKIPDSVKESRTYAGVYYAKSE